MRHKWVKLRLHVYICRVCGTGKVNEQIGVNWQTRYHRPNGESVVSQRTPACEIGPRTGDYLAKHAAAIAVTDSLKSDGEPIPC